jgi:hypothetical protein
VVYRVGGTSNKKLGETAEPAYVFKADLWNSYTFRVAAVTKSGKEGALGNVCALVHTPVEAAEKSHRPVKQ